MSNRIQSLGHVASAAAGITCSSGTNATPIVATIAPSTTHRLKNGDRIHISGVTGLTAMNGHWTVAAIAAAAATLEGSAGNGVFGGTAVVSVLCDKSPFLERHSCAALLGDGTFVGTALLEKGTSLDAAGAVNDFTDATKGLALGANPGQLAVEVDVGRYMRLRASAFTSGSLNAQLVA